jgi:hypothetical protein
MLNDEANNDARRTVDAEMAALLRDLATARKLLNEGLSALSRAFAQFDKANHCFHSLEWLLADPEAED